MMNFKSILLFGFCVGIGVNFCSLSFAESQNGKGNSSKKTEKERSIPVYYRDGNNDTFFAHLNKMDIPNKFKLKEMIVGNPSAKKTLIMYFSYTCPHCREFHANIYPKFKKMYVDTNKIKVIFRNYIDDQGAYEATQIIRCISKNNVKEYERLSELVLRNQKEWLASETPGEFLVQIFTQKDNQNENTVRACLKRTDIGAGIMLDQQHAMRDLHMISMPTFINDSNKQHVGYIEFDELVKFCGL